uniref:RNA-directed DNA polymerase n=1 Tax=Strigamia maritima TaxID=126957 RepID=T1IGZ7_STRMM
MSQVTDSDGELEARVQLYHTALETGRPKGNCFFCKKPGHQRAECESYLAWCKKNRKEPKGQKRSTEETDSTLVETAQKKAKTTWITQETLDKTVQNMEARIQSSVQKSMQPTLDQMLAIAKSLVGPIVPITEENKIGEDNIHLCKCEVKLRDAEICVKFSSISETSSENSEEFLEEGEEEIEQDQTLYSALTDLLNEIPPTREELIEAQLKDEFCLGIQNYLLSKDNEKKKSNKPPNWMEKIGGYMLDSKESTNKDALLVYFNPTFDEELNDSGNGFKAVVSLIRRVMFACHGHPLSGHAGISKTIHRTKQIYYWPKMSQHIRVYVRSCQHCQQYKPNQAIYTDVPSHWPKYLNEFAFASRTQVSEALGHTPMLLNTGREAPLPFDPRILYHGISIDKNRPEDYVKDLLVVLSRDHQNMYHKIQKNYERHKKAHNDKYHICEYKLGDLVWKKTHILSDKDNNITKSLAIKRDGPWEITKIHGGGAYELTKIGNRKIEKSINMQDLLPYILSYPIEEWEENQLVGTNEEHSNPDWMSQIEKNNIQEDIISLHPRSTRSTG